MRDFTLSALILAGLLMGAETPKGDLHQIQTANQNLIVISQTLSQNHVFTVVLFFRVTVYLNLEWSMLEVVLNIFDEISAENQNIVEPDNYGGFLNGWT